MKRLALVAGLTLALTAGAALAQNGAMTVQAFLTAADRIPMNPTALLRPDARRLASEIRAGFATVRREEVAARAAGRTPAACMPQKVPVSPQQLLARFNAIPAARRNITVTQAVREWMADRYPCAS